MDVARLQLGIADAQFYNLKTKQAMKTIEVEVTNVNFTDMILSGTLDNSNWKVRTTTSGKHLVCVKSENENENISNSRFLEEHIEPWVKTHGGKIHK